jgi:hypothetical protein
MIPVALPRIRLRRRINVHALPHARGHPYSHFEEKA